jgi:hypothetical protein
MPAQAGIPASPAIEKYRVISDNLFFFKIPAFAGMTALLPHCDTVSPRGRVRVGGKISPEVRFSAYYPKSLSSVPGF